MRQLVKSKGSRKLRYFLAAAFLMLSTTASAAERGALSGGQSVESQFVFLLIDVPLLGLSTRRLVRLPVVFPVPVI
jgi:hypothetical protein